MLCANAEKGGAHVGKRLGRIVFKVVRWLVWLFYPKTEIVGTENLPDGPAVIVANHTQMNGPIVCELYFPEPSFTWCAGQMMHLKEVPAYAFEDFWSQKPKYTHWFFKLASYVIAPLCVSVFNNARTIPVYRDSRLLTTFRETLKRLYDGARVVVFPEHDVKYNHIIYDFQDRFIDLARNYNKRTGKELSFVPMYIAPNLKKAYIGEPVCYCSDNPPKDERRRVCDYLMNSITDIACALPEHTVVPYRNIPKSQYPTNIPDEVKGNEKTCS